MKNKALTQNVLFLSASLSFVNRDNKIRRNDIFKKVCILCIFAGLFASCGERHTYFFEGHSNFAIKDVDPPKLNNEPHWKKPNWIVKGNFNNNGIPDFAVTNGYNDSVAIFLDEEGLFFHEKFRGYSDLKYYLTKDLVSNSKKNPRFITSAHFQNSSITDLVTANFLSGDISILLGDGNGTFQPAICFTVGKGPWSVAVGNFDNKPNLDVAVANTGFDSEYNWVECSNFVTILWNFDNGKFMDGTTTEVVGNAPKSIIAADLDGDNIDDLAVANALSNTVTILISQKNMKFKNTDYYLINNESLPFFITYNEKRDELFVCNYLKDYIEVYGNTKGNISFKNKYRVGLGSYSIDFADFDEDNKEDMAVLNMVSDNVSILLDDGKGGFIPAVYYQAGNAPHSLIAGKFFGTDSKADLLIADFNNHKIIQIDNPYVSGPTNYDVGGSPLSLAAVQLNETNPASGKSDHDWDLVTANEYSNTVSVLMGNGKGGFSHEIADVPVGNIPKGLTIGSFDSDNIEDDVAVATDNGVSLLLNVNDDGILQCTQPAIALTGTPTSIVAIDFINGKKQDLAIVALPYVYIYDVKSQKQIGSFDLGTKTITHSSITSLYIDGSPGLAIVDCENVTILNYQNNILNPVYQNKINANPWFIASGDFDGDKKKDDLVVTDYDGDKVYILLYDDSQKKFVNAQVPINVGTKPCFIAVNDFNVDGYDDLAVANWGNPPFVTLLKGEGLGKFTEVNKVATGRKPSSIAIGNFNNKKQHDMAVAYHNNMSLTNRKDCKGNTQPELKSSGTIGFVTIYKQ